METGPSSKANDLIWLIWSPGMAIVTTGFFPSNPSRTQDWSFRIDDWLESIWESWLWLKLQYDSLHDYDYDPVAVWTMTISSLILSFFLFLHHTSLWLHCLTSDRLILSLFFLTSRLYFPLLFRLLRVLSFNLEFLFLDCWVLNDPLILIFQFFFFPECF